MVDAFEDLNVLNDTDFADAVIRLQPRTAVFDCDGTLWSGDAGSSFMRWTMDHGVLNAGAASWLRARYAGYQDRSVSELTICGDMVRVFAGVSVAAMREAARIFFAEKIEPHIFPEMLSLVDSLRKQQVDLWAVSSTCDWVIEEGVRRFGIAPDRVLAARVRVSDDVATDEILDVPTDEGKVAALRSAGVTAPDAVFGNSIHDAAMLGMARRAFPVNPTAALVQRSLSVGWAVYWPRAVRPQGM